MFDFASYHRAATLADAINLLADNPQAKLLAGGTDVLIKTLYYPSWGGRWSCHKSGGSHCPYSYV